VLVAQRQGQVIWPTEGRRRRRRRRRRPLPLLRVPLHYSPSSVFRRWFWFPSDSLRGLPTGRGRRAREEKTTTCLLARTLLVIYADAPARVADAREDALDYAFRNGCDAPSAGRMRSTGGQVRSFAAGRGRCRRRPSARRPRPSPISSPPPPIQNLCLAVGLLGVEPSGVHLSRWLQRLHAGGLRCLSSPSARSIIAPSRLIGATSSGEEEGMKTALSA